MTLKKYSHAFRIEGCEPGTPISASNINGQTVAVHFGQSTSSPDPQYPSECCSLRYSATGVQDAMRSRACTTSSSVSSLPRMSLRVQYRTAGFLLSNNHSTALSSFATSTAEVNHHTSVPRRRPQCRRSQGCMLWSDLDRLFRPESRRIPQGSLHILRQDGNRKRRTCKTRFLECRNRPPSREPRRMPAAHYSRSL